MYTIHVNNIKNITKFREKQHQKRFIPSILLYKQKSIKNNDE